LKFIFYFVLKDRITKKDIIKPGQNKCIYIFSHALSAALLKAAHDQ